MLNGDLGGRGRVAGDRINQEELSENRRDRIEECKEIFSLFIDVVV